MNLIQEGEKTTLPTSLLLTQTILFRLLVVSYACILDVDLDGLSKLN